ncbi:MAG TPA: alpha/beta hydrolase [Gryllotalpicola sp.]
MKAVFEAGQEVTPASGFGAIRSTVAETRGIAITTKGAPGSHLNVYVPRHSASGALPVILWIHGGGFISSSADTVKDYAIMLANRGYVVANLDYSLAPGARHPVPVVQANAALAFLRSHAEEYGGDPENVFVGGDSAGAQIASEVAAVETSAQLAASMRIQPALTSTELRGVILFCGLYDMDTVGSTGFPALRTYLWAYTGSRDWTEYPNIDQLSTTRTATSAYPATFISVGDADPFRTQEAEFADMLTSHGVPVTSLTWDDTGDHLGHEYQFNFTTPQAETAFSDTLAFLASKAADK